MFIHVLLYEIENGDEGIHSIEINGTTIVLMFEEKDDAERYCGLLEAQDFPCPTVEIVNRSEIELFCENSGYEYRLVEKGFRPKSQEDRLLLSPPQSNLDVTDWTNHESRDPINQKEELHNQNNDFSNLDNIKKNLEDLL